MIHQGIAAPSLAICPTITWTSNTECPTLPVALSAARAVWSEEFNGNFKASTLGKLCSFNDRLAGLSKQAYQVIGCYRLYRGCLNPGGHSLHDSVFFVNLLNVRCNMQHNYNRINQYDMCNNCTYIIYSSCFILFHSVFPILPAWNLGTEPSWLQQRLLQT